MHGYYEILQGNARPAGLIISSIGPPCVPEETWNACEPAMTIVPSFLVSGILSVLIGLVIVLWSLFNIRRKLGGVTLILLSVLLLLFGGGFFPPLIGIIGGIAGLKIRTPITTQSAGPVIQLGSRLWPWPLVIFLVWVYGQWVVGSLFNDFLQSVMIYGVLLILAMMPLSVFAAYARDVETVHGGFTDD